MATEATRAVLRPGGIWIVCGPLEYNGTGGLHHDDKALRLCADELLLFISRRGFEILEVRDQRCDYTDDELSMIKTGFEAIFFVARRKDDAAAAVGVA